MEWKSSSYTIRQVEGDIITIVLPVTMAQLLEESQSRNPYMASNWGDMLTQPAHDDHMVIIETLDHITVARKLTGFYQNHQTLDMLCQNLERDWCAGGYNLPQDKKGRRHSSELPNAQSGTFHFAYWIPEGQADPVVSKDVLGNNSATRFGVVQTFLSGLSDFQKVAAFLMEQLEPTTYKEYRHSFQKSARERAELCAIQKSPEQIFYGCAVVVNKAVQPHRDRKDGGKVVMTVAGDYTGGDLILGSKGCPIRLKYAPGDVVVMDSRLLLHGVMPFEGKRRGIVLFSHKNVLAWAKPLLLKMRIPRR